MNTAPHIEKKFAFTGHNAGIYALCAAMEDGYFYSGSADKFIAQWNLQNGQQEKFSAKMPAAVYSLCLIKELAQLWVGTANGHIHVIDLNKKEEIHAFRFHQLAVFCIQYAANTGLIYSSGADGLLNVYEPNTLKHLHSLKLSDKKIRSILCLPDKLVLAEGNGKTMVLNINDLEPLVQFNAHKDACNCFLYEQDSGILLSGGRDAHLNAWDTKNNFTLLQSVPAHNFAIYSILNLSGTPFIATASRDKTIKLWNRNDYSFLLRINKEHFDAHTHSVNTLLWDEKNQVLVSGSDDRTMMAWGVR